MDGDRLPWIYSAADEHQLEQRYDEWAADYDADLDAMAWVAPQAAARQCRAMAGAAAEVLDAGCGTGLVGAALRALGVGRLVGLDLSREMLRVAAARGAYDHLVHASLTEALPFPPRSFDAVVSVGVFTFGHVGAASLAALPALVRPGGHVVMTFRDDVMQSLGFVDEVARLEQLGVWQQVARGEAEPMILEDGVGAAMRVWTWRVPGLPLGA